MASTERQKEWAKAYYRANKQKCDAANRAAHFAKREVRCAAMRERKARLRKHNEHVKAYKKWLSAIRKVAFNRENASRRRGGKCRWANQAAIKSLYEEAAKLAAVTGIPHEVDHIIPINGKTVSGLHVENNMQILTKKANRAKFNSFSGAVDVC